MKKIVALFLFVSSFCYSVAQPKMQATMKAGSAPSTIDIYVKPSQSFANSKDEAMTFVLAIRSTVSPQCSMDTSIVTANGTGLVPGLKGLQISFSANNFGATSRQVVLTKEKIGTDSFYVYTFVFAGTANSNHVPDWSAGIEQKIFSLEFSGCNSNCSPTPQSLVNLPNGGINYNSYWYYQVNTLGDITNYTTPFYANAQTGAPVNGGSSDGSALSTINLTNPLTFGFCGTDPPISTWAGTFDNNWNNAGNWCGGIPSGTRDVYIYSGANNPPSLNSGNFAVRNLYISSSAFVDLASGTLTIKGVVSGQGTFSGTSLSVLVIDGTAGILNFTPGQGVLKSLTLNPGASATVKSMLTIAGN